MELLSKAVVPEVRRAFRQRLEGARKDENGVCCDFLCQTLISVLSKTFKYKPLQLCSTADMLPEYALDLGLAWAEKACRQYLNQPREIK